MPADEAREPHPPAPSPGRGEGEDKHGADREYSKRLGPISDAQLQAACDRFEFGTLVAAEPAPGGIFGQNVMLETTAGRYVLRGDPHYDGQFAKERFFTRLLHEETDVPSPWPYQIEPSAEIFGWSYAVMPWLPGEQIGDPDFRNALPPSGKLALASAMGRGLARLHAARRPAPMEYSHEADALRPLATSHADWFIAKLREWLRRSREASAETTDADVEWVADEIASARAALDVPFEPVPVHTDYKENNCVASRTDGGWEITGVFDVGEMYFGDGEVDFSRMVGGYMLGDDGALARAFVAAYAEMRPLRPGYAERFRLYMLNDRLILWEYGQRNGLWFRSGTCLRDFAERFVSAAPDVMPDVA